VFSGKSFGLFVGSMFAAMHAKFVQLQFFFFFKAVESSVILVLADAAFQPNQFFFSFFSHRVQKMKQKICN